VLEGALAALPGANGLLIYTEDMVYRGPVRSSGPREPFEILPPSPVTDAETLAAMQKRKEVSGLQWGAFVRNEYGIFANVSMPLYRDGVRRGWIIAPVELYTLSRITRDLSDRFETHAFIIDGAQSVLADQALVDPLGRPTETPPLSPLAALKDPVLAKFADREPLTEFPTAQMRNIEISQIKLPDTDDDAFSALMGERSFIAITKEVAGYGERPWTLGAYFGRRAIGEEIMRTWVSAAIGLGGLLLAVVAAIVLGKRLARPVREIASQAQLVADFDLDRVKPLPRSRVLELDDQASAFNAMLVGLRAFSTYIPRSLVAKLVRTGEIGIAEPREAIVTVMFTDIAGFTTLSEHMDAASGARLLNHHFEILCQVVDAEGGTVDKFLGDGMLAFFGAPDRLKGHAAAAVRAAAFIRAAMQVDNAAARAEGRPPLKVRIGIHTGPVIVGNIGAADRVNYTIIGDTVNVSQRLQGLAKEIAPEAEVSIVVSGETASRLDERFETVPAGKHLLRGRGGAIDVFVVGDVETEDEVGQAPKSSATAA
jgi:adenylate cyclase